MGKFFLWKGKKKIYKLVFNYIELFFLILLFKLSRIFCKIKYKILDYVFL